MHLCWHTRVCAHTYTPKTHLNGGGVGGEALPELFPFSFSKALLVAKQQGGLLSREWDGREGKGGGRWKEKRLGVSGHPGWTFPATQPPAHTLLTGLRVMGVWDTQNLQRLAGREERERL